MSSTEVQTINYPNAHTCTDSVSSGSEWFTNDRGVEFRYLFCKTCGAEYAEQRRDG